MTEAEASVLLVDDEPRSLVALEALLSDGQARIVTARSGEEALQRLLEEDFAVILLDVQMPGLDGFETAELIRMRDRSKDTPIVFLTAWGKNDDEVVRGYRAGAVDYVFKPVVPEILRGKVAVFLDLYRKNQALQRQNDELEAARRQAQRESEFKSKFLASMSHELRTPLNAIIGFTELLVHGIAGPLQPRQKEFLDHVLSSGRHLLELVNDVLDLSKIEAGRMELVREPVAVAELAQQVLSNLETLAAGKGIEVMLVVDDDVPELDADPLRLKQVLYNLLSNAIKFTQAGGHVSLVATLDGESVRIDVEDDGVGIKPDQLGRLFREFEQIEGPDGRPPEGTGLGLALTRKLVEAHGGRIDVESEYERGSRFSVWLPAPVVAAE